MRTFQKCSVQLMNATPEIEKTCIAAAKTCYSEGELYRPEDVHMADINILKKCLKSGHWSVVEHASLSFNITNVSRVLSHQLVRNRLASYSQRSQRKTEKDLEFYLPESIEQHPEALKEYLELITKTERFYQKYSRSLPAEDLRYAFQNAKGTKITVTMNCRELLHFFQSRLCCRAQSEIRELAQEMLKLARERAPLIFADENVYKCKYCEEISCTF